MKIRHFKTETLIDLIQHGECTYRDEYSEYTLEEVECLYLGRVDIYEIKASIFKYCNRECGRYWMTPNYKSVISATAPDIPYFSEGSVVPCVEMQEFTVVKREGRKTTIYHNFGFKEVE